MFEMMVIMIHTPFFLYGIKIRLKVEQYYTELGLNQIIAVLMISRMYMLMKLFGRFSKFQSKRATDLCYRYFVEPSVSFSIRAFLKQHPYILTMVCLVSIISVFGYAVQTFEM